MSTANENFTYLNIRAPFDPVYIAAVPLYSTQPAADVAAANGKNVGIIHSHHISQGLIQFDDLDIYTAPLTITANHLANAIHYVEVNITHLGDTVAFVVGHDTYVFQDGGAGDTLVQLVGVSATGLINNLNNIINGGILV